MPMVTSMKKNTTAQIDPPGNFNTTWVNEHCDRQGEGFWKWWINLRIGDKDEAWARIDNLQGKVLGDTVMQYDDAT